MVDFRGKSKTPAYLTQRFQRRMMAGVCLLGLIFFMAYHAGTPGAWTWLFEKVKPASREAAPEKLHARTNRPQDAAGVFVAQLPDDSGPLPDVLNFKDARRAELKDVRDNSALSTYKEDRLHYQMLQALGKVSQEELESANPETVSYNQLHTQPKAWRAELVHVVGTARLAYRHQVSAEIAEKYGFDHWYEIWVQPPRHKDHSYKVYCLELPPGFPVGERVFEPVEVTGLFYRLLFRNASDDSGKLHPNPVILARTVVWNPVEKQADQPTNWPLMWGMVGGIALAALIIVFVIARRAPRVNKAPAHLRRRMAKGEIDVFDLDNPETDRKVRESLAGLEATLRNAPDDLRGA